MVGATHLRDTNRLPPAGDRPLVETRELALCGVTVSSLNIVDREPTCEWCQRKASSARATWGEQKP